MNRKLKTNKKQVIINALLADIHSGVYKPGDMIPPEMELAEKYGFGRQTVHNALYDLSMQGILKRTRGKGSFVAFPSANRNIRKKMSFTEDMLSIGMTPSSQLLEYKIVHSDDYPEIANSLQLKSDTKLIYLKRLRFGNEIPIALQYHFLPADLFPSIELDQLTGSLDAYISRMNIEVTGFVTRLRAVEGTAEEINLLHADKSALLMSTSIRYTDASKPFQYTKTLYRSDRYEYTFSSFE